MSETPLDQQDRRMPEPSLIEWLRDQQRVFDQGGASKDRRPELAATLLERVIRQRDEATLEVCQLKKNCQCCRDALSAARETILSAGGIEDRISPENDLRAEITTLRAQLEDAGEAAKKANRLIVKLTSQLEGARKGCLDGVTGTSIDPERPSCLLVHFDHDVTEDDRERIRSAHNSVVTLRAQLEEARAKAIEESAQVVRAFVAAALRHRDIITATDFADVEKTIRSLIAGSTK